MSRLIPAVGYARRSTDGQVASIPDQVKAVKKWADERGYQIKRWYTDDAVSGDATEKRHAFLQMIDDARTLRDFDAIVCWDDARFGRFDSIEAGYYIYPLRKAGVYLATVMDGVTDWNDSTGRIVGGVKQEGKHQQLLDLSANVTRGQLGAMNAGSWVGSSPYGYRIEGERRSKRLVLGDPAAVRIVQRIFREFVAEGRSMNDIARRLQAEGYPSPGGRGKPWRSDTVKVILENPAYTGDYAAGRYSYGKYNTIRQGSVVKSNGTRCSRPESEWIIRPDHHESIVDRATFEKAKATLAKGKTGRTPYTPETNPHLLSGLLRCGHCKCPLWVLKGGYYECSNRRENGKAACLGTTVREDRLLHSIADHLDREFLSLDGDDLALRAEREELLPSDLPKAFAKVKQIVSPPKQPAIDRRRTAKRSKALAEQIDTARRNAAYAKSAATVAAIETEIERLGEERELLEAELRKRPPSEDDVNVEATEVLRSLWWLRVLFRSAAQEFGRDPNKFEDWFDLAEDGALCVGVGAGRNPWLRQYLRRIAGITVHTRIEGRGTRTRHVFEQGEISLETVRSVPSNLNPHHPGKSRGCCR